VLFTETGVLVEDDIVAYMCHPVAVEISLVWILYRFNRMLMQVTVHAEDPVRKARDQSIIMRDQQDRLLSAQSLEQFVQLLIDHDIYIRSRFIEDEIFRIPRKGTCNEHTLSLAS
jgi:hypothetical protein